MVHCIAFYLSDTANVETLLSAWRGRVGSDHYTHYITMVYIVWEAVQSGDKWPKNIFIYLLTEILQIVMHAIIHSI